MSSIRHFRINTPQVVNETIDGEVVIINFDNGNYYSSDALGCEIWALLEQNQPVDAIVGIIDSRYTSDSLNLEEMVRAFIEELGREQLIVPAENGGRAAPPAPGLTPKTPVVNPPRLNKFKDMQDLLLLDPIHDVDAVGWPMQKQKDA